jgi:hypothetical protein
MSPDAVAVVFAGFAFCPSTKRFTGWFASNPFPLILTEVPTGPDVGEIVSLSAAWPVTLLIVALAPLDDTAPPVAAAPLADPVIAKVASILTVNVLSLFILWSTERPCMVMPFPSIVTFAVAPLAGSRFTFVKKVPAPVCMLFKALCVSALWPVAFRLLAAWLPVDCLLSISSPSERPVVVPDVGAPVVLEVAALPPVEFDVVPPVVMPDVEPEDVVFAELPIDELLLLVAFSEVPLLPDDALLDALGWPAVALPLVVALDVSFAPEVMAPVSLPVAFELALPDVMFDSEPAAMLLLPLEVELLDEPPTVAEAPPVLLLLVVAFAPADVLLLPADVELLLVELSLGPPVIVWPRVEVPVEPLLPPELWLEPALLLLLGEVEELLLEVLLLAALDEFSPVVEPPAVELLLPELAPDDGVAVEPPVVALLEPPPEGSALVELLPEVSFDWPPVTEPPVLLDGT